MAENPNVTNATQREQVNKQRRCFPARFQYAIGQRLHADRQQPCGERETNSEDCEYSNRFTSFELAEARHGVQRRGVDHDVSRQQGQARCFAAGFARSVSQAPGLTCLIGDTGSPGNLFPWPMKSRLRACDTLLSCDLFVNGETKTCAESISVAGFIEQLGMKGDRVAVELNREICAARTMGRNTITRRRPARNRAVCRRRGALSARICVCYFREAQ